jgi:hypothetical protein
LSNNPLNRSSTTAAVQPRDPEVGRIELSFKSAFSNDDLPTPVLPSTPTIVRGLFLLTMDDISDNHSLRLSSLVRRGFFWTILLTEVKTVPQDAEALSC